MSNEDNNLLKFDKFKLDAKKKVLWYEDSPCDVPIKAVELLCVLTQSSGEIVSKDELMKNVWQDSFVEESVLPQNIYFLRRLFKKHGIEENLVQTVPRRGYRFAGELTEEFEEETVIEREVIERKLIAESDLTDEEFRKIFDESDISVKENKLDLAEEKRIETHTKINSNRLPLYMAFSLACLIAVGLIGWFLIYPNLSGRNSAKAFPAVNPNVRYERISESGRVVAVGLSPDDQHAAYVVHTPENKYQMVLKHLATESETVIVKPQDKHLANIRFSPDGNYIYYIGNDSNDKLTAYKMPLYGGVSQPIVQDFMHIFNVSPDGEWLAFIRRDPEVPSHHLEIARSSDGSERRTVVIRQGKEYFSPWGTGPAWSHDGKKLIAAAFTKQEDETKPAKSHLVEIDVESGEQTNIKTPENWRSLHEPYYSSDGKSIYLKVRERIGEPVQIYQLDLETGKSRNLTNDSNDYREFRVASDGSFLITATWSKSENLFLVPTENPANIKQLTFDSNGQNGDGGLVWTIDGKHLLYTKTKGFGIGNIWMMNVETGEARQLTKENKSLQGRIDVTPDGKSFIYESSRAGKMQIWRSDFDGMNQKQLTDGKLVFFSEISPDGKWIYYSDNGFWKVPSDGGEPIKLADLGLSGIKFSPTDPNEFSAYFQDEKEKKEDVWKHAVFNLETLPEYKDLKLTKSGGRIDWTPDGKKIYFISSGENFNNVWTISPETLEKQQVTNFQDQRIARGALSPDGKTLALSRGVATGNIVKVSGF